MPLNYDSTAHARVARSAAAELRRAGLKATPQRLAIVDALDGDTSHPTAQELFERVRAAHPQMAFATVYNTLRALERVGRVRALSMGGATRFDPNVDVHDHAVCDACGAIFDVARARTRVTKVRADGFSVHRVERIYRGTCAACSRRRTSTNRRQG